jgi:hypothetical protein
MLDLEKARKELKEKGIRQIHEQTAWTWASRSIAAFELSLELQGLDKVFKFSDAQEYAGEAKEHAAQVSSDLLREIEKNISVPSAKATLDMVEYLQGEKNV